ncbi:hypothetical protein, partial [Aeromonas sp. ZOR0002]|uniref:hypothetical protein n=1 Tax=Aeromonas sp. ZOR0002 TaxID=1339228 RepID=UPI001E62535B
SHRRQAMASAIGQVERRPEGDKRGVPSLKENSARPNISQFIFLLNFKPCKHPRIDTKNPLYK